MTGLDHNPAAVRIKTAHVRSLRPLAGELRTSTHYAVFWEPQAKPVLHAACKDLYLPFQLHTED